MRPQAGVALSRAQQQKDGGPEWRPRPPSEGLDDSPAKGSATRQGPTFSLPGKISFAPRSLAATLKTALGKHAHPGLACQRRGPPESPCPARGLSC